MRVKNFFNIIFFTGLFFLSFSSCRDEKIIFSEEDPTSMGVNGDVINVTMTLDYMGGTRADDLNPVASELEALENYIDPDKTRVLFFDSDDNFLFESKSRWVKQLDATSNHIVWSVYVPLYTYGNDKEAEYNWNWTGIREKLTSGSFKIAILANRPAYQYYPELNNSALGEYWFDNSGPKWGNVNSSVYQGTDGDLKNIFDLHHAQYDPIYYNKCFEKNSNGVYIGDGTAYDFIMEDWDSGQPLMSSTSSWLDYSNGDSLRDSYGWDFRYNRMPSKEEPIPMYGVQKFEALTGWEEGTSMDLSRDGDKPISLLRSVVKMEMILPAGFADDVVLFYGNWFTRCEPLDVWTPTDEIWNSNHGQVSDWRNDPYCEMKMIWDRTPICYSSPTRNSFTTEYAGIEQYKKVLMWQYGIWRKEKNWSFDKNRGTSITNGNVRAANLDTYFDSEYGSFDKDQFPHIFNPCIQRVQRVNIRKTYTDGVNDHYIVYCGERNVNDPTTMCDLTNTGSGNSPVIYWSVIKGTIQDYNGTSLNPDMTKRYVDGTTRTFSFPMVDFGHGAKVYDCVREGILTNITPTGHDYSVLGPNNSPRCTGSPSGANGNGMGEYARRVAGNNDTDSRYYRPDDHNQIYTGINRPVPLIRNHIYTIKVTGTRGALFNVSSEVRATEDICFKE